MIDWRKGLQSIPLVGRIAIASVVIVGFSFLLLAPYAEYCQQQEANHYNCAAYEVSIAIGGFIESHNGAISALAAAVTAYFTFTIWRVNSSQLEHSREIERAYVSGGGTRHRTQRQEIRNGALHLIIEPTNDFDLRVNNFGKTSATIHHARVGFFDADAPPDIPPYGGQFPLTDVIGPGIGSQFLAFIPIEGEFARTAICGRFYWHDIWGQEWSSGFVYEIPARNAEFNGAISIETPAAYRDEHRE